MWGWIFALGFGIIAGLAITVLVVRKLTISEIKKQLKSRGLSKAVIGYMESGAYNKVQVGLVNRKNEICEELEYHADELGRGIHEGQVIKVGLFG
jgi:hypothetical protein